MRILNSCFAWALVIVSVFTYMLLVATDADATRPVVGFKYKDMCKNIKGKQPAYMTVGADPYRLNLATKRPRDCIRVR